VISESHLNVYIIGEGLSPRAKERLQAQVQTALRFLSPWVFDLLQRRLAELGQRNFPLIVEPRPTGSDQAISFGEIDGRPAVQLLPAVDGEAIDWYQDQRYLVAKAAGWFAAPADEGFRARWREAVAADGLREAAADGAERWRGATDTDLLLEMFAAACLKPEHDTWDQFPAVRAFFKNWRRG